MARRYATIWTTHCTAERWTSKQILGSGAKMPEAASKLISVLNKYSMKQKQ